MATIFDKIINKELPADVVYEDDQCLAFRDIAPKAPTHILLIPKTHIESMATVTAKDQELLGYLMLKASEIAAEQGLSADGYRLVVNTNEQAGQTVYHLHIHILGGKKAPDVFF